MVTEPAEVFLSRTQVVKTMHRRLPARPANNLCIFNYFVCCVFKNLSVLLTPYLKKQFAVLNNDARKHNHIRPRLPAVAFRTGKGGRLCFLNEFKHPRGGGGVNPFF
jgi:hypothetical protein